MFECPFYNGFNADAHIGKINEWFPRTPVHLHWLEVGIHSQKHRRSGVMNDLHSLDSDAIVKCQ